MSLQLRRQDTPHGTEYISYASWLENKLNDACISLHTQFNLVCLVFSPSCLIEKSTYYNNSISLSNHILYTLLTKRSECTKHTGRHIAYYYYYPPTPLLLLLLLLPPTPPPLCLSLWSVFLLPLLLYTDTDSSIWCAWCFRRAAWLKKEHTIYYNNSISQ